MSEHNGTKLSQRLHACVQDIWPRYLTHPFVMQMADGTLPMQKNSATICCRTISTSRTT